MANDRVKLKVIGNMYVSGPVDTLTFSTEKLEAISYTREEALELAAQLRARERITTVIEEA